MWDFFQKILDVLKIRTSQKAMGERQNYSHIAVQEKT